MIIGVDPGLSGAIAVLENDGTYVEVFDIATKKIKSGKKSKTVLDDERIIRDICLYSNELSRVYLERVSAMPGQGVTSMFNFGSTYGFLRGVLTALVDTPTLVTPTSWKRYHDLLGSDKDESRLLAQDKYPLASLSRKKDCDRADALLIAEYGRSLL